MYSTHSFLIRSGAALVASLLTAAAIAPVRSALTVHASGDRPVTSSGAPAGATPRAVAPLGGLPLHFEPRDLAGAPAFVARGQGYNLAVTAQGATVSLAGRDGRRAEVGFAVAGSVGAATLEGDAPLPGVVHRYVGDRTGWQPGLRTYGRVVASHVRPGIDVVYYGNQRQLEYDFVIAPGASPADAGMIVSGADRAEIDIETGDLLVHVGDRVLRQRAPVAHQERAGVRTPIASAFTWDADANRVGFTVGEYDRTRALVIDPVLVYSSWFGGESEEVILAMKVDADGFIYVLGYSADKAGFPTTPGAFQPQRAGTPTGGGLYPVDYFVSKFNPAGSALVYSTLIGGSGDEATWFYTPGGLDVDAAGRVYIVGDTASTDFPVTPDAADAAFALDPGNLQAEAFYARLKADGTLDYSTFIGGLRREAATGVDVDAAGNVYVVGKTASNNTTDGFVTTPNAYRTTRSGGDDLFVQRYSPAGVLLYSTYFGGSQGDMTNRADIVANGDGKVTFGSDTVTGDVPTVNGFAPRLGNSTDGFVSQIDTDLAGTAGLLYSTYISGFEHRPRVRARHRRGRVRLRRRRVAFLHRLPGDPRRGPRGERPGRLRSGAVGRIRRQAGPDADRCGLARLHDVHRRQQLRRPEGHGRRQPGPRAPDRVDALHRSAEDRRGAGHVVAAAAVRADPQRRRDGVRLLELSRVQHQRPGALHRGRQRRG